MWGENGLTFVFKNCDLSHFSDAITSLAAIQACDLEIFMGQELRQLSWVLHPGYHRPGFQSSSKLIQIVGRFGSPGCRSKGFSLFAQHPTPEQVALRAWALPPCGAGRRSGDPMKYPHLSPTINQKNTAPPPPTPALPVSFPCSLKPFSNQLEHFTCWKSLRYIGNKSFRTLLVCVSFCVMPANFGSPSFRC